MEGFIPLTTKKIIGILFLIGFLVFANSLFNGFVADDDGQVLHNLTIQNVANIPQFFFGGTFYGGDVAQATGTYYRPMVSTTYALLHAMFGLNPFPFHLFQLLIHICNAVLVFLILRLFLKKQLSFLFAILFLVHPIQAETVDYIADLQDVLFFFFGALACYLTFDKKLTTKRITLAALLLLLSLFSKETGIIFGVILVLYQFLFGEKRERKTFLLSICGVMLLYILIRLFLVHSVMSHATFASISQASYGIRLMTIPLEIFYYLKTLLLPFPLALNQMWLVTTAPMFLIILAVIIDAAVLISLFLFGKKLNKQSTEWKAFLFFTTWFFGGLLLHLHIFFPLDATVADRWFYFPFVGLLGIVGLAVQRYIKQSHEKLFFIIMIVFLLVYSFVTILRNTQFRDNYSLLSHDVPYSKHNPYMHSALAIELMQQQRFDEAYAHLQQSIKLHPQGDTNWNILGHYYQKIGKLNKAEEAYRMSIKNAPYYLSYEDLGLLLLVHDTPEKTAAFTKDAVQKFPTDGTLWFFYALSENKLGNKEEAFIAARQAATYFPNAQTYRFYQLLEQDKKVEYKIKNAKEGITIYICSESVCQ